ncbi:tRNA pseudouridine(38-40) synthase TruA [Halobacillus salinarum]|nr:tRNA pseudouridine(38-40) synthase TruA [Halobacillus salinarum]
MKCRVEYDGTKFAGYQIQPNGRTVQEELENALTKMHKGTTIKVTASGRTDAGVHAKGQIIHFDTFLELPEFNWKRALSTLLPADIQIAEVNEAEADFHARYDTSGKEYRYFIWNAVDPNLFRRNYTCHIRRKLDVAAMQQACSYIKGEHDFTSFCSTRTDIKGSKVRTITKAELIQDEEELCFVFEGTGFLYNMVRILVGTLIEIGMGERKPEVIPSMIEAENREAAGKTAPAQGLFLWKVHYA